MTASAGHPEDRQVIPRWRSFADTTRVGDLGSNVPVHSADGAAQSVSAARARVLGSPSAYASAELISALLSQQRFSDVRRLPEAFYAKLPVGTQRLLVDGGDGSSWSHPAEDDSGQTFDQNAYALALASSARQRLKARVRNPAAWVDLALAYTVQGYAGSAERAIRVALQLAPDNRFVLRSAARHYVHRGTPDEANAVLGRSRRVAEDPWLLAAHVSTAQLAYGRSPSLGQARILVEFGDYSARAKSELTSELATAEMKSGHDRKARELFRRSLQDPTENAVAQGVTWAERGSLQVDPTLLRMERVYEARALESSRMGDWAAALGEADAWHRDQPFSIEPFWLASYAASVGLADYKRGFEIADRGLRLRAGDNALRNNAAYALANLGRTAEAREFIAVDARPSSIDDYIELATLGLIHYRELDAANGYTLYQIAIAQFAKHRRLDLAAIATVHWAMEELRLGAPTSGRILERALKSIPSLPVAERETLSSRLNAVIASQPSRDGGRP